uniref:G_PROTEIN_RECEP_F1_2 domain-containing protein n=1 Tax=Caenorhabditis tropicalis TaxID=1561998 RepID=A0A1I7UG26_9PELO
MCQIEGLQTFTYFHHWKLHFIPIDESNARGNEEEANMTFLYNFNESFDLGRAFRDTLGNPESSLSNFLPFSTLAILVDSSVGYFVTLLLVVYLSVLAVALSLGAYLYLKLSVVTQYPIKQSVTLLFSCSILDTFSQRAVL